MALIPRTTLALTLVAAALTSAPAAAGLRETYNQALEALEAGRWQESEQLLRAAIRLKSDEARRVTFKGILRPYLPHFYRGVALARLGDCRTALDEWRLSLEQGVVVGTVIEGDLGRERQICERRLEELGQLAARATAELETATALADRLAGPERAAVLGTTIEGNSATLGQRLEQVRLGIDETRDTLARADADESLELAEEAASRAAELAAEIRHAVDASDRALTRLEEERARKRTRIAEVQALAARVGALLRSKSPLPPALRSRQQQLESILAGASTLRESATIEQIEALERRLLDYLSALESSEPPPPGTLRSGAIAYLRADYPEVLERLAELPERDAKTRAHALLLRSAAAFALHVRSGETDGAMLARARADARAAKETLPELEPTGVAFSPRFVRFYQGQEPATPEPIDSEERDGQDRAR